MQYPHLICYDASCPLCLRSILFIIKHDQRYFCFTPLGSTTSKKFTQQTNSVVLITNYHENPQVYQKSKALLKILWHLKIWYFWLGAFSFLSWILDLGYRFVAKHRDFFFKEAKLNPSLLAQLKKRTI